MNERKGDMFAEYLSPEVVYVVTTNGYIKNDGTAVMGRGTALVASRLHGDIPHILGDLLLAHGNRPFVLPYNFVTLPVKHRWDERADLELIDRSLNTFDQLWDLYFDTTRDIYMPRPGCGNGQLDWSQVKPLVENYFGECPALTVWSL